MGTETEQDFLSESTTRSWDGSSFPSSEPSGLSSLSPLVSSEEERKMAKMVVCLCKQPTSCYQFHLSFLFFSQERRRKKKGIDWRDMMEDLNNTGNSQLAKRSL